MKKVTKKTGQKIVGMPGYNANTNTMKKGGIKKATAKKPLPKAQDGKIIKSKKVRTADINTFGPSVTSVSKTKRDGSTVTKSINTNQGYVPYASMTKTVTDKSGKSTSTEKDINWNKALKKQARVVKNVGRNPDDQGSGDNFYKKGGTVKPSSGLTKKQKSSTAQSAKAGKDIGKKGKMFDKVAAKAAKKYGSAEAGKRVAAAAMWKNKKR